MVLLTRKLSEEANRVVVVHAVKKLDPLQPPPFRQTEVLSAPKILALRIAVKPLQFVAWLLLTAYAPTPSPTRYGHLFSRSRLGE